MDGATFSNLPVWLTGKLFLRRGGSGFENRFQGGGKIAESVFSRRHSSTTVESCHPPKSGGSDTQLRNEFVTKGSEREVEHVLDQIPVGHSSTDDHEGNEAENPPVEEFRRPFGETVHRFSSHFAVIPAPFGEFAIELA